MGKHIVQSQAAPAAIGPYSQAVKAGDFLFCSGQIALDPATGQVIAGDVVDQTEQVIRNLRAVLEAAGATMESVVKTTIFLTDLGDFGRVNDIYGKYFVSAPPARSTVQVAALPKGVRVEIEAIAYLGA